MGVRIKNTFLEYMRLHFLRNDGRKLRITGSHSLKFPSSDIDFANKRKSEILLSLHEMSLLGSDSPLPDSLLRDIRSEQESSAALREFFNMLQHHIAMLRFNALLKKSNFLMQELGDNKWQTRFALHNEKFSPESLRRFFVKIFPNCKVAVHCFEPLKIENPAPFFLGKSNLSGANLLGKTCTTITEAMRVDIGSKRKDFLSVKFPFKIRVVFHANGGEIGVLGQQKLSENFWLGKKNFETLKLEKWL